VNYAFADLLAAVIIQRPELGFCVRVSSISVFFQVVLTVVVAAFVGLDKAEFSAFTSNLNAISKAAISIALVLLGFGVVGAVIGAVAGYVVAGVVGLILLLFFMREKYRDGDNCSVSGDLKSLIFYGAPLYVSYVITSFLPMYQSIMLAIFATDFDIGNFNVASNFLTLMLILTGPIATALLPAFSKLNSSAEEKMRGFFKLANKYTALIIVPVTFLMIVLSRELVYAIYGPAFASAPIFLAAYSVAYFLSGLVSLALTSLFNGLGETKIVLKMNLIAFVLIIVLSPVFTYSFGVLGVIAASLSASLIATIYVLYIGMKKFKVEFDRFALLKICFMSAISCLPVVLLIWFIRLPQICQRFLVFLWCFCFGLFVCLKFLMWSSGGFCTCLFM